MSQLYQFDNRRFKYACIFFLAAIENIISKTTKKNSDKNSNNSITHVIQNKKKSTQNYIKLSPNQHDSY